jgi:vancomycin permeability regulator SanA
MIVILSLVLVAAVISIGPYALVQLSTSSHRHRDPAALRRAPVALVLGAGVDGAGQLSWALARRVDAAVELYRRGQVQALLMSGDNSRFGYDEPSAMREAAVQAGIPRSAIVLDYAGFDTYSSCFRAHQVFGLAKVTLVSQEFHLSRAIWLCHQLGVDADGFAAADADGPTTNGWRMREVPASVLAVVDVLRRRDPIFPGPRDHSLDAVVATGG